MFKIHLSDDIQTGKPVYITEDELRTHLQIAGVSGKGKSKELENIILQLIENKKGFCLIDPHGTLFDTMVQWLETNRLFGKRKIILFDPYEERYCLGFNPFQQTTQTISYLVDMMVLACASVWGGEDPNNTPRLSKYLTAIFHLLIEKGLTLYESMHLISSDDFQIRQYLTKDIKDPQIKIAWDAINSLSKRNFDEEIGSTSNRLMRFLSSEIIRRIIGQNGDTINFKKLMDEGAIVLVNLKAVDKISFQNTCLLGTLLINSFYMACLSRDARTAKQNPFYLIIDECPRYITEDIPMILDEGRKFGLHLMLSYQRLQQLRKKIGEDGFEGVLGGAQSKIVFGGIRMSDALMLAEDLFVATDQINMQETKKRLYKPQVVGYRTREFGNWSKGTSHTDSTGESDSWGESTTETESETETEGESTGSGHSETWGPGETIIESDSDNSSSISGRSSSRSTSRTSSTSHAKSITASDGYFDSEGGSEGLEPIMEELWTEVYSLEEQKTKAASLLVRQPMQHAIIQIVNKKSVFTKIPFVPEPTANENRVQRSKEQNYLSTQYIKTKELVDQEIEKRQQVLKLEAEQYFKKEEPKKKNSYSFREAEPDEESKEETFRDKFDDYEQPNEESRSGTFRNRGRKKKTTP